VKPPVAPGDLLAGWALRPGTRTIDIGDRASAVALGSGGRLPFPNATFELAVSLHALEVLPDRRWALSELRRVLVAGGGLAVAVWGPLEENPAFSLLADSLHHRAGAYAEASVHWLSSLSHADDLRALLGEGGFVHASFTRRRTIVALPSVNDLFGWLLGTFPIGAAIRSLPGEEREGIASDLNRALGRLMDGIPFTTDVHTALATGVSGA
jgi:SAM-dependent methyltransferase